MTLREQAYEIVRQIPSGTVTPYSEVGRALSSFASGLVIGRWMASCPDDIPWWRVVAKNGSLPVDKKSPHLRHEQRERLEQEGVEFEQDCVIMDRFAHRLAPLDW